MRRPGPLPVAAAALVASAVATLVLGHGGRPDGLGPPPPRDRPAPAEAAVAGPEPVPLPDEPAITERTVVVTGSGWGHSVGMSQYGAQAQALAGRGYRDILAHYYPGVALRRVAAAGETIRVHLFRNRDLDRTHLVLQTSSTDGRAPARDVTVALAPGTEVAVPFPERWQLTHDPAGGTFVLHDATGAERGRGTGPVTVRFALGGRTLLRLPQLAPSPRTRLAGTFRHGVLEVRAVERSLHPVLVLPVEDYLGGLAEMPSGWHVEALKAQAVAGRTYAVRTVREGVDPGCRCHLGTTPHDQAYAGWGKEGAWRGQAWRRAVRETTGEVATYAGELAWTYYSSSHGGATEDSGDSWAYGTTLPYLRSVADPWSLDPAVRNPYERWRRHIPSRELARAVGLADVERIEITERTAGGTPLELLLEGVDAAGRPVRARYRGLEQGVAGSALKLHFRSRLPSQQIIDFEVVEP